MSIENAIIADNKRVTDDAVAKVTLIKTEQIALDVYYFQAGQSLGYHRHPTGDQIFTVIEGAGTFKLDDGTEELLYVTVGSTFLAPKNVWHDLLDDGGGKLVAQQVTHQPAGMEKRS